MIHLIVLKKQFLNLKRFCKCSVKVHLNSMECSKTTDDCLHTQKMLLLS